MADDISLGPASTTTANNEENVTEE